VSIPRRRPLTAALLVILASALMLTAPGAAQAAPGATGAEPMPPLPVHLPTDSGWYYTLGGTQRTVADGAQALLSVGWPVVAPEASHSLAAIAVRSADGLDNVQIGWTVDKLLNGDDQPRLFVIHRSGGVDACYNDIECGFEPYAPSTVRVRALMPAGEVKRFIIQHSGDRWWVGYDTQWVGSFPDTLWSGGFVQAAAVQYFGEVSGESDPHCSEMGTGWTADNVRSARISGITLINGTAATLTVDRPDKPYTISQLSATAFRYGGRDTCL
jgi:neprosin-like protein